jgi:SAM-dependent methyltransferase
LPRPPPGDRDREGRPVNEFDPIADVYEDLVAWAPYETWVEQLARRLRRHGLAPGARVLDAACGTGLSALPWARRGFEVVAADRSEPMLAVARRRAQEEGLSVRFLRMDLLEIDLPERCDLVQCMHSGLDYILDLRVLAVAFRVLRRAARTGGLLAFDKCLDEPGFYRPAHSNSRDLPCGRAVFHYQWDRRRRLFDQRCVIFRDRPDGGVDRTEVLHRMRAVAPDRLAAMVEKAGFRLLEPPRQFTVGDPGMGIFRAV